MKRIFLVAMAFTILALQACNAPSMLPNGFIGSWDSSEAACKSAVSLTRLIVTADSIRYWESEGKITGIKTATDTTVEFSLAMSGEGEEWVETIKYSLVKSGSELVENLSGDAESYTRIRCVRD